MTTTIYEMGHQHLVIIVAPVPTRAQQASAVTAFNTYLRARGVTAAEVDLTPANLAWRQNLAGTQVLISLPYKTRLTRVMAGRAADWLTARGVTIISTYNQADAVQWAALQTLLAGPLWSAPTPF